MKNFILFFCLFLGANHLIAQIDFNFYYGNDISLNNEIAYPGELSGHTFGEWHFSHDQLVNYMKTLAEQSDRVQMIEYGRTYENRPLYILTISSPENLAKIEEIRQDHLDFIFSKKKSENNKLIIWLGYGVHGNESSASNASMLTAYYLASSREQKLKEILDKSIIIIDPCLNPDGFDRSASWVNMHQSNNRVDDQHSIQFTEYWPGGRTNHYWFDLNRDWLLAQHPESKARLKIYHQWMPTVLTDHHEMGSNGNFFFQPGVPSRNNPLTPGKNYDLTLKISKYHGKALDQIGTYYFSEESFDDFYFGKGSSYPDINGAIGILFEQSRVNGQVVNNRYGKTSFAEAIRNQFTVSLSTINASMEMKEELVDYQKSFYAEIPNLSKDDAIKAFSFGCKDDPVRLSNFLSVLNLHQIDVYKNNNRIKINNTIFEPGESYLVPLQQNQYRLIKSMFAKQTNFKDSLFYDISTWNFPFAFNIDYKEIQSEKIALGNKVENPNEIKTIPTNKSNIGYLFSWTNYNAPKLLYQLQQMGIITWVVTKPTEVIVQEQKLQYSYGSIFIPVSKQTISSEELYYTLNNLALKTGVKVTGLESGYRNTGLHLGSSNLVPLKTPKTLMLIGNGINSRQAGEIWHLMDYRMDMFLTRVDQDRFNRINLFDYNTLILPDGDYSFTKNKMEEIQIWLKNGGNIITIGESVLTFKDQINITKREVEKPDTTVRKNYILTDELRRQNRINGVILQADVDITHPIGYGLTKTKIPVFRNSNFVMEKTNNPYSTPVFISNELLSGYLNNKSLSYISNSAYINSYSLGEGHIIAFTDNPNFRAIWFGTNKLFLNSIFFGQIIR